MTIAIAAITEPDDCIVAVSDRMISYDDITQAEDNAILKGQNIARNWGAMFAGNDARLFGPLIQKIIVRLDEVQKIDENLDDAVVKNHVKEAYQELFDEQFTAGFLSRLHLKNIEEFRKTGFVELGPDVHREVYRELAKFELGIQLLVYGYDQIDLPHVFEVVNPGKIIDHDIMKCGVIGSGYWMATASLRRRPMSRELNSTIYRLLEAKFSAETATGVGKATNVFIFGKDQHFRSLSQSVINQVRSCWQKTLKPDAPASALKLIEKNSGLRSMKGI